MSDLSLFQGVCPPTTFEIGDPTDMYYTPINVTDITWNYEKFLIDKEGKPRYRFNPEVLPHDVKPFIEKLVKEGLGGNHGNITMI